MLFFCGIVENFLIILAKVELTKFFQVSGTIFEPFIGGKKDGRIYFYLVYVLKIHFPEIGL